VLSAFSFCNGVKNIFDHAKKQNMSVEFIAAAPEKLDIVDFESVCCGYF
jgi:hypothetical protein